MQLSELEEFMKDCMPEKHNIGMKKLTPIYNNNNIIIE